MADNQNAGNAGEETVEDAVISMVDYLKEEQELLEDANAVLGDSDENQCTYQQGYKTRQALYACSTCETRDKAPAGVCLGCSYACHDGHDLYELYTKRNFRCDCGNGKFTDLKCKLFSDKEDWNTDNQYNQNFRGLYCVCARPYPDPDDEVEDEMIQCIVCEDWYHGRHLGECKPPSNFQEMICPGCMCKHDFLWAYTVHSIENQTVQSDSGTSNVSVDSDTKSAESDKSTSAESVSEVPDTKTSEDNDSSADKKENSDEQNNVIKQEETQCLLKDLQKREITVKASATFWPEGFRRKLCICADCKAMYKAQGIEYLADENDSMVAYEMRGLDKHGASSEVDQERQILEGMGRVQQIEMVQGFNDMKTALSEYLKRFAENGKVVRAEDIREFFTEMEQRKRRKIDHAPAHFCR